MTNLVEEIRFEPDEELCNESESGPQLPEKFFTGPIRLSWLQRASQLGGKALNLGIALLFEARVSKRMNIKARPSLLRSFGVERHAGYRALKSLEIAGLVKVVTRRRGTAAEVTLIKHVPASMTWEKKHYGENEDVSE